MAEYTPEWQEQHTTVPPETIRRVARDFVAAADVHATITLDGFEFPLRPAVIKSERGAYSTTHGAYQHFAVKIVAGLVGATDVPGGFLGSEQGPVLSPGPDGVVAPKQEAQPVPWQMAPVHRPARVLPPPAHQSLPGLEDDRSIRRSTGWTTTSTC